MSIFGKVRNFFSGGTGSRDPGPMRREPDCADGYDLDPSGTRDPGAMEPPSMPQGGEPEEEDHGEASDLHHRGG